MERNARIYPKVRWQKDSEDKLQKVLFREYVNSNDFTNHLKQKSIITAVLQFSIIHNV